jgi:hypothetical protein
MPVERFELENPDADPTLPDGTDGWFEVYDADEDEAWLASDTTVEVEP